MQFFCPGKITVQFDLSQLQHFVPLDHEHALQYVHILSQPDAVQLYTPCASSVLSVHYYVLDQCEPWKLSVDIRL